MTSGTLCYGAQASIDPNLKLQLWPACHSGVICKANYLQLLNWQVNHEEKPCQQASGNRKLAYLKHMPFRLKRGKRTAADSTSLRLFSSSHELLSVNCACLFTLQPEMIKPRGSYIWFTLKSYSSKLLFFCNLRLQNAADVLWESFWDTDSCMLRHNQQHIIWDLNLIEDDLFIVCVVCLIVVINMLSSFQRNALQTLYGLQCEQKQNHVYWQMPSFLACSRFKCVSFILKYHYNIGLKTKVCYLSSLSLFIIFSHHLFNWSEF